MKWSEIKIHEDWLVHLASDDNGKSTGQYIIKHLKCPDGAVLPGDEYDDVCTECHTPVPTTVIKRLPFIINRDKLIS